VTNPRRRIVLLAPFPPSRRAAHGGAQVVAELLSGLATRHDVALVYLESRGEQLLDPELERLCVRVIRLERPRRTIPLRVVQRLRLAARLGGGKPRWVVASSVPAVRPALGRLLSEWKPDLLQLEFIVMCDYLDVVPMRLPVVLTHHDPRTRATREFRDDLSGIARFDAALDASAWQRFEERVLDRVDTVVVFTDRDREALEGLTATPIVRIPAPSHAPEGPPRPLGLEPPRLFFNGNFQHEPNLEAALRLARTIFPAVRAQVPEAQLQIVGPNPSESLRRLAGNGIEITGLVADVRPYLEDAALVVAPIRSGGGMRIKVLDGLCAGKPVVGTARAFEGLDVTDGVEAIVANGNEELVEACVRLLRDPAERERLGTSAFAWAREHVGREDAVGRYESLYDRLLGD
jgi:glycosyltransferase involved in cell wall biosynthesis